MFWRVNKNTKINHRMIVTEKNKIKLQVPWKTGFSVVEEASPSCIMAPPMNSVRAASVISGLVFPIKISRKAFVFGSTII